MTLEFRQMRFSPNKTKMTAQARSNKFEIHYLSWYIHQNVITLIFLSRNAWKMDTKSYCQKMRPTLLKNSKFQIFFVGLTSHFHSFWEKLIYKQFHCLFVRISSNNTLFGAFSFEIPHLKALTLIFAGLCNEWLNNSVLLTSAPSTGKTTLMVAKAIEIALKKEKVLFLIYTSRYIQSCHRLLELQLAVKFANLKDFIKIEQIKPFVQEESSNSFR